MKAFMDKDFLLETPTAQHLYHDYSAKLPIIDYHCHIPPQEIYENRRFENIARSGLSPVIYSSGTPLERITRHL